MSTAHSGQNDVCTVLVFPEQLLSRQRVGDIAMSLWRQHFVLGMHELLLP